MRYAALLCSPPSPLSLSAGTAGHGPWTTNGIIHRVVFLVQLAPKRDPFSVVQALASQPRLAAGISPDIRQRQTLYHDHRCFSLTTPPLERGREDPAIKDGRTGCIVIVACLLHRVVMVAE